MRTTIAERNALRTLGQHDLSESIPILSGEDLWTKQREVARAISVPKSQVVVPSCYSSGKTWLAARIALAFYDAFTPGTDCDICGGPCGGSKIITTSTKEEHLKDNLWGEIRKSWPKMRGRYGINGRLWPADTRIEDEEFADHFITGLVATKPEGFQGYHAKHVLVIGDEATALSEEVAEGIRGILASGDARLLLILNPTDGTTFAAAKARSSRTQVIRIRAWDTPPFTGEAIPEGASFITQDTLDGWIEEGDGPGTYNWTTKVEAEFWDLTEDTLIADGWYIDSLTGLALPGTRALGIDIASYGTAENVIAVRDGNSLAQIQASPSQRVDMFFQTAVTRAVKEFEPHYVIYDADGVGAGAIAYAEALYRLLPEGALVIPFRGAKSINDHYTNARSAWYWSLRKMFESQRIAVLTKDSKLHEQAIGIRYSIKEGKIRVETKDEMRKRGMASPDRLDAVMYAFAYSTDLPIPIARPQEHVVDSLFGVHSRSDEAMWSKDLERMKRNEEGPGVHPILGVEDW